MILVDSSVWITYFNGQMNWQSDLLDDLLEYEHLLIGDLILTEVLQGFRSNRDFDRAKEFLALLDVVELGGYQIAIQAASNYRAMRKKGITIRKTIDVIIGTYCIENSVFLLHDDQDFIPMEQYLGLPVLSQIIQE
jgi:predicted nucleic acid-binding protein